MTTIELALLVGTLFYLLLLDVLSSRRVIDRAKNALTLGDSNARPRLYRNAVLSAWAKAIVVLVALVGVGFSFEEIGFTAGTQVGEVLPYVLALPIGLVASTIAIRRKGVEPRLMGDIAILIPQTRREQKWFAVVSVTAGITEEIVYRALPVLTFMALFPNGGQVLAGLFAALYFGLAHAYQGLSGIVGTALMGGLFAALYIVTGSLWPPILMHVLVDLRILFLFPLTRNQPSTS